MYDHIGLKVKDLEASVRFYRAALAALGHELCSQRRGGRELRPGGRAGALALSPRAPPGPACTSRSARPTAPPSTASTSDGLKAGGRDNGRPGLRADYSPTYYAAFLIDPDGNNVEAVCTR